MIEKAILIACMAIVILFGISAIGSQINRMMTEAECAISRKTLCIIEDHEALVMKNSG